MNIVVGIMVAAMVVFIYLLPTYIAIRRKHRRTAAIYILNLFFGWTLLGWVVTFIMACVNKDYGKKGADVMKGLKTFLIAILFFVCGAGSGVYFVSNIKANKETYRAKKAEIQQEQKEKDEYRLVLKLKEIEFDDSGLEGVYGFNVSIFDSENEVIRKVWPAYKDVLTAILEEGLKKQNLRIVSDAFDESEKPIAPDFLKLKINAVRGEVSGFISGSVNLYLSGVFVNYETKKFVNADRWHKSQAFMASETEAAKILEGIARGLMNDFINDYRKANLKKTDTVPSAAPGR